MLIRVHNLGRRILLKHSLIRYFCTNHLDFSNFETCDFNRNEFCNSKTWYLLQEIATIISNLFRIFTLSFHAETAFLNLANPEIRASTISSTISGIKDGK